MNFSITNKICSHHPFDNKFELRDKSIDRFSLKQIELREKPKHRDEERFTFSTESFSEKNRIEIGEILEKLIDINLNGFDCD